MSYNWHNILVSAGSSLEEVIKVIDQEALQIALVVDGDKRLLGTVTDGDIRRALLQHIALDQPASKIMNTSPCVAKVGDSRETILKMMTSLVISSVPITNDHGVLVGLETLHDLSQPKKIDNPVFLMAGGFGTRLAPLTDNCPKPLLKVGDKPILETIILECIKYGFHNFYISTHYKPEAIREYFEDGSKWGINITYVHEDEPLGTAGALANLPSDMPQLPMLMMNGDLLTKADLKGLLDYHNQQEALATMGVREYEFQVPFGVIDRNGTQITGIHEKPMHKWFVNAGIYVLNPDIIKGVVAGTVLDMPTLLQSHIDDAQKISMFPIHEYWLDIGQKEDFVRAQKDYHESFK